MTKETREFIRNCSETELLGLLKDFAFTPDKGKCSEDAEWVKAIQDELKQPPAVRNARLAAHKP